MLPESRWRWPLITWVKSSIALLERSLRVQSLTGLEFINTQLVMHEIKIWAVSKLRLTCRCRRIVHTGPDLCRCHEDDFLSSSRGQPRNIQSERILQRGSQRTISSAIQYTGNRLITSFTISTYLKVEPTWLTDFSLISRPVVHRKQCTQVRICCSENKSF